MTEPVGGPTVSDAPMLTLVLRAAEEAAAEVATLRARGEAALAAPCLAFVPLPAPDLDAWRGRPAQLMVTSVRAVPAVAALVLDPAWHVLALAPKTAAALREAGVRVDLALAGGAAALAAAAGPAPLLALTSDLGGDEARKIRPDLVVVPVYRTAAPASLPPEAAAALAGDYALRAASPSALRNLDQLHPGAVARAVHVVAFGATTRLEAERLGARLVLEESA